MSNSYEDKLIEFFSDEENFINMVKVASHLDVVSTKIIRNFWSSLEHTLNLQLRNKSNFWNVKFSDDFNVNHCKLWAYKNSWVGKNGYPLIAIAFENLHRKKRPYVGIFIFANQTEYYDISKLTYQIRQLDISKAYSVDKNPWWCIWEFTSVDFLEDKNLVNLLPQNVNTVLENFAERAIILIDSFEIEIDKILVENAVL